MAVAWLTLPMSTSLLTPVVSNNETYPWFALKVRARAEDTVQQALDGKGYRTCLPAYTDFRQYSDRIKRIKAPLFPGYLFSRFDVNRRLPVLTTVGVEYVVGFGGTPQPVADAEIAAIEVVTSSGLSFQPWPFLQAGNKVRIGFGCLAGLDGLLVRTLGADRLVLSVEMLQRSIAVEIDRSWVHPAANDGSATP